MPGVVSLLDDRHTVLVERVWTELAEQCGLRGVAVTPFPHVSYHVADAYDTELVGSVLQSCARRARPFRVRTAGVGLFSGPNLVVYIPVVRGDELADLHRAIWRELGARPRGSSEYYAPDRWIPHITLAHTDVGDEHLSSLFGLLGRREFEWEIPIDNLTLLGDADTEPAVRRRFALGAPPAAAGGRAGARPLQPRRPRVP